MTPGEFAAIEARAAAATEGPWTAETTGVAGGDHWYVCDAGEAIASISCNDGTNEDQREPDAEFIAHAREDIPRLLAAVRERDNTIARVQAYMNEHEEYLPFAVDYDCCARCNAITGSYVPWPCDPYTRLRAALDPQETP